MDTPFDSTLESDIKELLKEVPAPIRAFFASGKVEIIAKSLMQRNKLHIDQGAVVEREIILLLLGLKDPAEFVKTLSEEAKLDAQTVNSIVQDINAQIFVPLREEEMKGGGMKTFPAPGLSKLIPAQKPDGTPPNHSHSQNKIPAPLNVPRSGTSGERSALRNVLAAVTREGGQTSLNPASRLLEDHEEPHIDISEKVQVVSSPAQLKPYNLPLKPVFEPPPNLPGAIYHPPIPKPPAVPPTPPKPKSAVPIAPYSSDPYREPLE